MSAHPDAAVAVGEVVGEVLDRLGDAPDASMLFVSDAHAGSLDAIVRSVTELVSGCVVGCTTSSVLGGAREIEDAPAISLWSGHLDDATPVRLRHDDVGTLEIDPDVMEMLADGDDHTLILLVDPYSFDVDSALRELHHRHPRLVVVGGMASPSLGPGSTRLFVDGEIRVGGAVGLLVGGAEVVPIVSQGCRPIGHPMVVTRASGQSIEELAGRPAIERLEALFSGLDDDEKHLVNQGLHLGRVVDENLATFDRGDFLIRGVLGADHSTGALVVGDSVDVGDTVQFQIRDATSATEDLRLALWNAGDPASALVFTCNGRGQNLFHEPHHDASEIHDRCGIDAVAGMFCAGEIGPVGPRSFVHGFTASIAFFGRADAL